MDTKKWYLYHFLIAAGLCFLPNAELKSWVPKVLSRKVSHKAQTPLYRQLSGREISTEKINNAPGSAEGIRGKGGQGSSSTCCWGSAP